MVRGIVASNLDRYDKQTLDALEALATSMESNKVIPKVEAQKDGFDEYWNQQYQTNFVEKTWQNVPFYPIEAYLFRVILQIVGFNDPKSSYYRMDPFERSKLRELIRVDVWTQLGRTLSYLHGASDDEEVSLSDKLYAAVTADLWSNKIDLNFKPGTSEKMDSVNAESNDENLLVDDRKKLCDFMVNLQETEDEERSMGMVCDNSGAEFLNDLMLCDLLLSHNVAESMTLHVKLYPTYVSDVTRKDVEVHLSHLYVESLNEDVLDGECRKRLKDFYQRLTGYLKGNRLRVKDDHFWNSAHCFDAIPEDLKKGYLNGNCMVIFKGDANYRRLVLAKMWDPTKAFSQVIGSYFDGNLVTLRTMKSDCAVGIDKEVVNKMEAEDPHWRHNGKRGVIQCHLK